MMGFKNQGVWYFLCTAPAFPVRIAPHYFQFGPPPPCAPPMMASNATQLKQGFSNGRIPNIAPPMQPYNANYGPQMMR
jgi:hypothetical protein